LKHHSSILLCESCGYPIGELPREGKCPECGRAIAESLPERRVGTPWQQKRGVRSWARTAAMVARRPRTIWDTIQVERKMSNELLSATCFVVGILCAFEAAMIPNYPSGFVRYIGQGEWGRVVIASAVVIQITALLLILSMIEYGGIRLFGARRRWRVTDGVAMAVVGHASVGWLLAPITMPVCWAIAGTIHESVWRTHYGVGWFWSTVIVVMAIAGPLIPLLAFELLVYDGVRRMRFANSEPSASSRRA
jgi:predicted RNA-binding Zn-ribbon protein involved in translation (DUF1610 family)